MIVSSAIEKMIAFYQGNLHDINHFLKVWAFAKTIGEQEGLDDQTQLTLELAAVVELLTPQHWMLMQTPSPVKTVFWQLLLVRSCPSWVWWKKHQRPQRPTTPCSRPSRPSLVPVGQRPSPHPSTRSAQCFSMTAGHQRVKTLRA